ncbi:hypothetical protein [Synechococcus sp. A15-24]|uniref:hypothetical protein n=1 Tax=Synechococcus sp. A15-24 TaxID=1050635 RepID=UPI001645FDB6|nr:hypothetical protein [Synechococcus sp. A15-24]
MINVQAHAPAGTPLPSGWKHTAPLKAQQATQDYLDRLQNAWLQQLSRTNQSELMDARLRPTSDSRADALSMVSDDEIEEVWSSAGAVVRIKKRHR